MCHETKREGEHPRAVDPNRDCHATAYAIACACGGKADAFGDNSAGKGESVRVCVHWTDRIYRESVLRGAGAAEENPMGTFDGGLLSVLAAVM